MLIGIDGSRALVKDKAGVENYSYELIKAMLGLKEIKKHKLRLYVRGGVKVEEEWRKKLEVVEIKWPRLWTQGGLALECLRQPADVLFIPAHTLPVIRRGKMKTVVTIHGLEYEYLPEYYKFPQRLYLNKSTEYAVRQADRLIAVSKWVKQELVKRLGANEKKIKVVHEGVSSRLVAVKKGRFSSQYMRQIRHKYGLKKRYILFVGTIQPRKNIARLIEAFSRLEDKEVQLVIGGKKGWMYEEIMKAPKKWGVEKRVRFTGRIAEADLASVYKGASLFCWPSLMEGFGLPILEAMLMGIPVITSNRGALAEIAGQAALEVEAEDVGELGKAMDLVLENQDLREGLVEKGYGRVKQFSWQKAGKETLRVLTEW